jgi:hypothetical protein
MSSIVAPSLWTGPGLNKASKLLEEKPLTERARLQHVQQSGPIELGLNKASKLMEEKPLTERARLQHVQHCGPIELGLNKASKL